MSINPYDLLTDDMSEEKKAEVFFGFIEEEMKKNEDPFFSRWENCETELMNVERNYYNNIYLKYRNKGY